METSLHRAEILVHRGMPIYRNDMYILLQKCSQSKDMAICRDAHKLLAFCGFSSLSALMDPCIRMFTSCGSLLEASLAFSNVSEPSSYTWHAIISAHLKLGLLNHAFNLYYNMQSEGMLCSPIISLAMVKGCTDQNALSEGRILHFHIMSCNFEADLALGSALIYMYGKCGSLVDSEIIFNQLSSRDVVVWNAMISVYAWHGHGHRILEIFDKMQTEGLEPHIVTFSSVLRACSSLKDLEKGRKIHGDINRSHLEHDVVVGSALVDMYSKCHCLTEAQEVFDKMPIKNVVTWNALITGYGQQGLGYPALNLFIRMQCNGVKPDKITFLSLLKSCDDTNTLDQGQIIHEQVIEDGFDSDLAVGTTLVDMYARLGSLDDAQKVFDTLSNPSIISWGALISGYVQQGHGLLALGLYSKMCQDSVNPDKAMLLCLLKACANAGAMAQGKHIHDKVIRGEFDSDMRFGAAIVDMYAKCGSLDEAQKVFLHLRQRDIVSWSVMISAYAQFGDVMLAQQCLEEMQSMGLKPDHGIYTSLLTAYSHTCDIQEGLSCFESMKDNGIKPRLEHYNSMIILLSHAGTLNEAGEFAQTMPLLPCTTEWTALLAACRAHGDINLASQCFDKVTKLEPNVASGYVIMSNMYADSEMWEDVEELKVLRKCASAWKKPGGAWIEVDMEMHTFLVDDQSHQDTGDIFAKLDKLKSPMRAHGYIPQGADIKLSSVVV